MATALNIFKTVTHNVTTSNETIYTAPSGYTGIVLMAQIANISTSTATVTFSSFDGLTQTELLKDFEVPANDAVAGVTGKLILESGSSARIQGGANNQLKITLSILESANE